MRDLVVFTLFVVLLPSCFLKPWFGLMAFTWMAYNRTQDLTWGFAKTLPIAEVIAIAMILGWMAWEYRPLWFKHTRLAAMALLLVVIGVSLVANGVSMEVGGKRYIELVKIVFIALLTAALLVTRARLRGFCLVVALGLGFYGVKNAIHYLLGGGTIVGPGGMLKDNNDFALAMVMNLPFLWYCSRDVEDLRFGRFLKWFLRFTFFMTLLTIASTGSRGGFLAMASVLIVMAWKTRWKVPALTGLAVMGLVGLLMLPQEYKDRLASITSAEDQSAQGRLVSWKVAGEMIKAKPVLGIGFNNMVWQYQSYFARVQTPVAASKVPSRVAHNSYLQIWAESGSIAFGLFLYILIGTILAMRRVALVVKGTGDDWITPYANTIQVTLIGYMAGAMFLNRAHFDLMYQLVAVSAAMPIVILAERERQAALKKRRLGPKLDHEVWVRHRDPFARLPSA